MSALAIAHRAGNSLAGLHEARELGVDVIECDVHHHRGRLEVRHLKTAGPLPFLWDRGELVSASAPRLGLEELLAADRQGTALMLDLKGRSPATARLLAGLVHDVAHQPLLACGRFWASVDAAGELPYVRPVLSARNRLELARLRRRLASAPGSAYGASVHASLLTRDVVAELHRGLELVMTWPVNDTSTLDRVLGLGVTGVISDEADVLAELLDRRRAGPHP